MRIISVIVFLSMYLTGFPQTPNVVSVEAKRVALDILQTLQKEDSSMFVSKYGTTIEDLKVLRKRIAQYPYISDSRKQVILNDFRDTLLQWIVNEGVVGVSGGYANVQQVLKANKIRFANLEFVECFYEIEYKNRMPLEVFDDLYILCKVQNEYYKIDVNGCLLLPNKVVIMGSMSVEKFDSKMNLISNTDK